MLPSTDASDDLRLEEEVLKVRIAQAEKDAENNRRLLKVQNSALQETLAAELRKSNNLDQLLCENEGLKLQLEGFQSALATKKALTGARRGSAGIPGTSRVMRPDGLVNEQLNKISELERELLSVKLKLGEACLLGYIDSSF